MPKYIMVYTAQQAFDVSTLPKEEITKQMEAWGEWLGTYDKKIVDEGDAFKFGGKVVSEEGVNDADNLRTGYTIIEADNFDEALAFAQASPALEDGGKIQVYEAFGL